MTGKTDAEGRLTFCSYTSSDPTITFFKPSQQVAPNIGPINQEFSNE